VERSRLQSQAAQAREQQLPDQRRVPRGADTGQQDTVERAQPQRRRLDRVTLTAGDEPQRAGLRVDRVMHVIGMSSARRRLVLGHDIRLRYFADGNTGVRFSRMALTPSRTSGYENDSISSASD